MDEAERNKVTAQHDDSGDSQKMTEQESEKGS